MTARKSKAPEPSADEVRRNVLRWFYDLNRKGRAPKRISDVCTGIKAEFGYKAPLVKEHLTLLCDLFYIKKETVMTQIRTGHTTREQAKNTYRVAARGIEYMEGRSDFSDKERYPGINVTATGGSTIVLGDGNVVNSNNRSVYDELGKMLSAVADSTELNDSSKLEISVNIETIRDQLALDQPNQTIIETAWESASRLATTVSLAEYVGRIAPLIVGIFA